MHTLRRSSLLTSNQLDQPPQPQENQQRRKLLLLPTQNRLQHKGHRNDHRIEEVERGVRVVSERVVVAPAEGPEGERDFNEEEGGNDEGDVGEDVEPEGRALFGWRAAGREEGVGEIGEGTGGVNDDLRRSFSLSQAEGEREYCAPGR